MKIKKGDTYIQIKDTFNIDDIKVGEIGAKIEVLDAKNTGLQFVDFKVLSTGKKVIGQYRHDSFLEHFEKSSPDPTLKTTNKTRKTGRRR
jgi:hypothetical protein